MSAVQRSSLLNVGLGLSSLEAAGLLLPVWNGTPPGSDPARRGLDRDVGAFAVAVLTSAPALLLTTTDRLLCLAALLLSAAVSGGTAWSTFT